MIVMDDAGRITSFSAAAERLFGFAEAEVVGQYATMLLPEADRAATDDDVRMYLAAGSAVGPGMIRLASARRRGGETFPVELAVGETLSGGQRFFTGFIRDLTERERIAHKMQDLQSELIHVSRLSAMGTMASTLAHELNQPLTAITSYLEATRDMLADPDDATLELVREALADAAGQSIRAGQIVRRLRDFTARGDVEQRPELLSSLVREAAALGLIGIREAGVRVAITLDETSMVVADRIQIQQVLVNLMRNSIEAMHSCAQRELTISTFPESPGCMQVSVSDSGVGLSEAMRGRLFQAFATTKEEGMGVGLSICRTIVEAHGGRIWATAGANGGTAFHFTLRKSEKERDGGHSHDR